MAYDEHLAERIRELLERKRVAYSEKAMMGGLAVMVDDKMLCGITSTKTNPQSNLMARVGAEAAEELLSSDQVVTWDLSKSRMKDYVLVGPQGIDAELDLERWVDRCLAFNPLAKRSKRRRPKS